mmetsp:Transcript_24505/g.39873  ORF Transcript_24505/g.39873 Transcript_24505/m.39873 type:complete len:485 (+) Transcript_24505:3431-4885(+)
MLLLVAAFDLGVVSYGHEGGVSYHRTLQDHFDPLNINTWHQAYYVNDAFWDGPESGAPVFVCVGGEGKFMDASVVHSSVHCNNAVEWLEETGALMVAVVHRYYTGNMSASPANYKTSVKNYKFLTVNQALADLAMFHVHISQRFRLDTQRNKFVLFGGSYPGMLAAFARLKYPHLFYAAVASSAPVGSVFNMRGYNDVVAQSFTKASVGGSQECRAKIAKGHGQIGDMLRTQPGRTYLERLFRLEPGYLSSRKNQVSFCGSGVAKFDAQNNDPACSGPACNIMKICRIVLDKKLGNIEALAKLRRIQRIGDEDKRLGNIEALAKLRRIQPIGEEEFSEPPEGIVQWNWQICTEFGHFHTCDIGSECMFTQGLVDLSTAIEQQCTQFNFTNKTRIMELVTLSGNSFGGTSMDVERILWVNGEIDPCISQSPQVLTEFQRNHGQIVLLVKGASHHPWTHPSKASDSDNVVNARIRIREIVGQWIKI